MRLRKWRRRKLFPLPHRLTLLWLFVLLAFAPCWFDIIGGVLVVGAGIFAAVYPETRSKIYYQWQIVLDQRYWKTNSPFGLG